MNIENIISFIYVYRYTSFQKAAEALYITQPSLSSRIKSLEKDMDAVLFIRSRKGVTLTEKGKIFLPYAMQISDSFISAQNRLKNSKESIVIGSIISASTYILPNALYQFQQKNKHTSVKVITGKTTTMLDMLLNKKCHFAITEEIKHPDIVCETIYRDPISLFANPTHPFAKRNSPISMEEVSREPLVCFNPNSWYWLKILKQFHNNNLSPNIVFNIDSIEAAKSILVNKIDGADICFLPELSLETALSSGQVCSIPINPPVNISRKIVLIHLKETIDPYLREFAHFIRLAIDLRAKPSKQSNVSLEEKSSPFSGELHYTLK